jgi:hypothetical protein
MQINKLLGIVGRDILIRYSLLEVLAACLGLIISEVLGAFFPVHRKSPKANLITEPVEVNINGAGVSA